MIFLRRRRRLNVNDCHKIVLMVLISLISMPAPSYNLRICGSRLTNVMPAICKNQLCGYSNPKRKRSNLPLFFVASSLFEQSDMYERKRRRLLDEMDINYIENSNLLSLTKRYIATQSGKRSGIANECCKHRCSLAYLRTYCCSTLQYHYTSKDNALNKNKNVLFYSMKDPHAVSDNELVADENKQTSSMMKALAKLGEVNTRIKAGNNFKGKHTMPATNANSLSYDIVNSVKSSSDKSGTQNNNEELLDDDLQILSKHDEENDSRENVRLIEVNFPLNIDNR